MVAGKEHNGRASQSDSVKNLSQIYFYHSVDRRLADGQFVSFCVHLPKMIHIHIAFSPPFGNGNMPEPGTYQHQRTLTVRKRSNRPRPAFYLPNDPLKQVIAPEALNVPTFSRGVPPSG